MGEACFQMAAGIKGICLFEVQQRAWPPGGCCKVSNLGCRDPVRVQLRSHRQHQPAPIIIQVSSPTSRSFLRGKVWNKRVKKQRGGGAHQGLVCSMERPVQRQTWLFGTILIGPLNSPPLNHATGSQRDNNAQFIRNIFKGASYQPFLEALRKSPS